MVYRIQPRQRSALSPAGAPPSAREAAARRRSRIQPPKLIPAAIEAPSEPVQGAALDLKPERLLVGGRPRQRPSGALVLSLLGHVALGLALYFSPATPEDGRGEPAIEVTFVEDGPVGDAEADARAAPEPEVAVEMPPEAAQLTQTVPDIPPPEPEPEVEVAPPEPVPPVEIPPEPVAETPPPEIDVPPPEPVMEQPVIEPAPPEPEPEPEVAPIEPPPPEPKPAVIEPPKVEAPMPSPVRKPAPKKAEAPKPRPAATADTGENRANRQEGRTATGGAGGRSTAAVASWRSQVQAAILRNKPAPDNDREGVARVGFSVARNGGLGGLRLTVSSGSAALDAAALAAVRRAAPFPAVPDDVDAPVSLEVPIRFQIN